MIKVAYDENGELLVYDGYGQLCLGILENDKGGLTIEFKKKAAGSKRNLDVGAVATVGSGTKFPSESPSVPKPPLGMYIPWMKDPTYYVNGVNGLDIQASADRAWDRVLHETWKGFSEDDIGADELKLLRLFEALLFQRAGRDTIYRYAGRAINGAKVIPTTKKTLYEWVVEFAKLDGYETE